MNTLITGGSGFIGTRLTNQLSKENRVTVIDHSKGSNPNARYITSDYDTQEIYNKLKKIDTIYHLAWAGTPASKLSWEEQVDKNLIPTIELAAEAKQASVKKFVFLSSAGAVYGNTKTPFSEDQEVSPTSNYGKAKYYVEQSLKTLADNNFQIIIIRATNVIHPDQQFKNNQGLIPAIINSIKSDTPFELWGNSNKDYLALEDLVTALVKLSAMDPGVEERSGKTLGSNTVVNVGSGQCFNTKQIIKIAEQVVGKKIEVIEKEFATHDTGSVEVNLERLKSLTGWLPKTDMTEYIKDIFSFKLSLRGDDEKTTKQSS